MDLGETCGDRVYDFRHTATWIQGARTGQHELHRSRTRAKRLQHLGQGLPKFSLGLERSSEDLSHPPAGPFSGPEVRVGEMLSSSGLLFLG